MLITMAVHDTEDNNRTWMTECTLCSLDDTVRWANGHRLIISDNGSCFKTHQLYRKYDHMIEQVIYNGENLGTAGALNKAWRHRQPWESVCKIDNDVKIYRDDWPEMIETVFEREPDIGICGLKRRDLKEWPKRPRDESAAEKEFYRSELRVLDHELGERWLIIEICKHVMGTCQVYSPALLCEIGFLYQPGLYGFDDSLSAVRAEVAGFKSAFLHGVPIDHVDPGGTDYTQWKIDKSQEDWDAYNKIASEYRSGERPVYYDGGFG